MFRVSDTVLGNFKDTSMPISQQEKRSKQKRTRKKNNNNNSNNNNKNNTDHNKKKDNPQQGELNKIEPIPMSNTGSSSSSSNNNNNNNNNNNTITSSESRSDMLRRINLTALKRVDRSITDIVFSASHVVAYILTDNTWNKKNIEGTLFLVKKQGNNKYAIVILNRVNTNNLFEDIDNIKIKFESPFVFYQAQRNDGSEEIDGIWFYDQLEYLQFTEVFQKLKTNGTKDIHPTPTKAPNTEKLSKQVEELVKSPNQKKQSPVKKQLNFFESESKRKKSSTQKSRESNREHNSSRNQYSFSPQIHDKNQHLNPASFDYQNYNDNSNMFSFMPSSSSSPSIMGRDSYQPSSLFPTYHSGNTNYRYLDQPAPSNLPEEENQAQLLTPSMLSQFPSDPPQPIDENQDESSLSFLSDNSYSQYNDEVPPWKNNDTMVSFFESSPQTSPPSVPKSPPQPSDHCKYQQPSLYHAQRQGMMRPKNFSPILPWNSNIFNDYVSGIRSKEELRHVLIELLQDDSFLSQVYSNYLHYENI